MKELSIVVPVFNEEKNIALLYSKVSSVLKKLKKSYEIIFIDDGSTDESYSVLESLHKKDSNVKIIKFRGNFGQTAALNSGFKEAQGEIIVSMDADLQNDPEDIPKLLSKIGKYDVVSGWRANRKDSFSKKMFSGIARNLRAWLTNETLHDSGCTLKAYRKECFDDLELYGEMHRFIPTLLRWKGFRVGEVKVKHLPRKHGTSKYNYKRIFRGFVDLINAKLWMDYSTRPSYLFFKLGSLSMFGAFALLIYNVFRYGFAFNVGPILLASVLLVIIGIQFLSFGFLAEIQSKTYHSLNKSYNVEKVLGKK